MSKTMLADLAKSRRDLEEEELNSPDGVAASEVYSKLMACHLLEYDLCSAKFLWKRAPESAKDAEGPLAALWTVGRAMWTKDFPSVYAALHRSWPDYLQQAANELESVVRERVLSLVGRAYSSISVSELAQLAGLPAEQLVPLAEQRGWTADAGGQLLMAAAAQPPPAAPPADCQRTLALLTQYVSFLEN